MKFTVPTTLQQEHEALHDELRRATQAVCEGRATGDLTTIEDPAAIQALLEAVQR